MSPNDIVSRLMWIPLIYVPALVITALLGIPPFVLLRRFDLIRWWSATGIGAVLGALVGALLQSPLRDIVILIYPTLSGCTGALAFWLIWRLGQDSPKPDAAAIKVGEA